MKAFFILLLITLLASCAVSSGGYSNTSTDKLCMDYLTLPSYNINQNERVAELNRRNESCKGYLSAAKARLEAQKTQVQVVESNFPAPVYPQDIRVAPQPQSLVMPSQCTSVNIGGIIDTRCQPPSGSAKQPQCTSIDLGGGIIDTRCR